MKTETEEVKMQRYKKAKEMMIEGGITPTNLDKNYIGPHKRLLSRSKSRKKTSHVSPPRFVPHSNKYNEHKKEDALMVKESKEKNILKE